ncbi:DNA-3-methyladenine glycosylase I [Flectobacillus major]|jgi:DNA-3-methyladenine glycosylase I|uniref:DNA-3-methyladenine glycosylase I n=1 Tax=Flectobacillus major TaxID=103 RepID=UPI0004115E51|nr:DNA-3-methyladenine glycosylase I [Flectobacillus major]
MESQKIRCGWVNNDTLYQDYHDQEWGVPLHDDQKLFEFLILEGFQAGLSWYTVLKKRDHFRKVFDDFDVNKVAQYDTEKILALMQDTGIIRNRLKIEGTVINAQQFLKIQETFGSFDAYIWQFVEGKPLKNHWESLAQIPASTSISDAMSKDLKKRGFKFIGTTICYAFMQATGMVNDHVVSCYCH